MRRIERTVLATAVALMVVMVGVAPALAGQEAQQPSSIQGELMQVDTEAMTITVRPAEGAPVQFSYNDQTQVTGAQESVAGLATASDVTVTVQFTEDGDARTATSIEVHPAQP